MAESLRFAPSPIHTVRQWFIISRELLIVQQLPVIAYVISRPFFGVFCTFIQQPSVIVSAMSSLDFSSFNHLLIQSLNGEIGLYLFVKFLVKFLSN
ncbi:hypothetical protein LguiB_011899 [Lonicera macranthoides]